MVGSISLNLSSLWKIAFADFILFFLLLMIVQRKRNLNFQYLFIFTLCIQLVRVFAHFNFNYTRERSILSVIDIVNVSSVLEHW